MFSWITAIRLPTTIVAAASSQRMFPSTSPSGSNDSVNTRTNAANAATFTVTLMNAVTADGAPSYTSGVHWWNGTDEILNAKPTTTNASPASASGFVASKAARIPANDVLPDTP